jgi:hypothetical protein
MRTLALGAVVCLLFGCSDSGCSSMEPIAGGFPRDRRVENAAQVRLTPVGIGFVSDNIEGIVGTVMSGPMLFPVPPTSIDSPVGGTVDVCPDGGCYVQLEVLSVGLDPQPSRDAYDVTVSIQAWTADETGARAPILVDYGVRCDAMLDTRATGSSDLPVTGEVRFRIEASTRYTGLEIADLDATSEFEDGDLDISGHDSVWDDITCGALDLLLKQFIVEQLAEELNRQLRLAVAGFVCEPCDAAGRCAGGAVCEDGVCMRGEHCVPSLLGIEGRVHLGEAMASFSPGTNARLDLLLAAGSYADVTDDGGLALGTFGGAEPVPGRTCAPPRPLDPSIPTVMPRSAVVSGARTCPAGVAGEVHAVVGLTEAYLNRFGYGMHQAGGLCLGMGPSVLPAALGTIIAVVPSVRTFVMSDEVPLAMELRPAEPPVFELGPDEGDGPLVTVTLRGFVVDFLVYGHDRYARLFTATVDLGLDVNLLVADGQIDPSIAELRCENLVIDNSGVVLQSEIDTLETALCPTLESMIGGFPLGPFPLPPLAGFTLDVPDGGIGYLDEGGVEQLVLCASLGLPDGDAPAPLAAVDTRARLVSLELPRIDGLPPDDRPAPLPRATLDVDAVGARGEPFEVRARVDSGLWTRWTTERRIVVERPILAFDARHVVEVQSRVAGRPETIDPTPAALEVTIDRTPPETAVAFDGSTAFVEARDLVTPRERIVLEWRLAGDETWEPVVDGTVLLPWDDAEIEVRATDEAGNVSVSRHAIRGRLPDSGSSGCGGCAVARGWRGGIFLEKGSSPAPLLQRLFTVFLGIPSID